MSVGSSLAYLFDASGAFFWISDEGGFITSLPSLLDILRHGWHVELWL